MRSRRSTIPFLVLLAPVVFVGGAPAPAVSASGAPHPTNDAGSRGKETAAVRPEAARLVTGSPVHLQSVVAGTPPTAVMKIVPVAAKVGSYPGGTTIVGNELTAFTGGFRAWFEFKLSHWDPNGDNVPPLRVWQFKIDTSGFLGANADPSNPGVDLTPPVIACVNNAACVPAFGEAWAKCNQAQGFCMPGYVDRAGTGRPDSWCADTGSGSCDFGDCNTNLPNFTCFSIYAPGVWRPDAGIDYYGATVVLDIPAGAEGKYTVNLNPNPNDTFLSDTADPPNDIPMLSETGFVVNILTGSCCYDLAETPAHCEDNVLKADCGDDEIPPFVWTAGKTCAEGCVQSCCLPGGSCELRPPADCSAGGGVLTTACLGDGDASGRDDGCEGFIPAGSDCWKTVCDRTQVGFYDNPIPAGFFDPGSDPFAGQIRLGGASGPGDADTQVRRLEAMVLDDVGQSDLTPAQLESLNLVSCDPIEVMTNGVPVLWNVQVGLSTVMPPVGNLTATKTHANGGTFEAQFPVQARFVFFAVSDPGQIRVLDTGQAGQPPVMLQTLGSGPWVHRLEPGSTVLVCGENFVPGVEEDPTGAQCCRKVGHAGPNHLHETAPPDCSGCPTVPGACCDPTTGECSVVAGALSCSGDYKGGGTDCRDTDEDGLADVVERNDCGGPAGDRCDAPTNPLNPDTDGDGCLDGDDPAPCDPCEPAGGCAGMVDCDSNGIADRCELPGNDCNGDGTLDRCEAALTGACCNTQSGCAELTKAACDALPGWVFQGYCTRCPTQNVGHNVHDGVAVVHSPTPVPECSITGGVAAVEDCTGRVCLYDTWITDPNDPTCHNFDGTGPAPSIPADFFGPGSDPFVGQVCFQGVPLGPTSYGEYGEADTIICRSADPFDRCALPSLAESTVSIQIVALSLLSHQPILVTYYGGQSSEFWNVAVALSDVPSPLGILTAVKTHCNGGTYTSILPVQPKFTFTSVDNPTTTRQLDTGTIGGWPVFTLVQDAVPPAEDAPWIHDPQAELRVVVDPCTNFHPGIRDVLQVTGCDCNGNLQRDKCDLEGTSQDCNNNGIPDDCELSGNDCNANGIPDECEPDCNGNGRADGCDVPPPAGTCSVNCSADCNANGMPDECEPDCNGNGRADACDLALNSSQDCTLNGRPDECDLGAGATADCQRNQRPDACDLLIGVSADANADGVPDECGFAPPQAPLRDTPDINRTRTLGMVLQPSATASGPAALAALRVTMVELQNPVPLNAPCCPPPNFGAFESATCTASGEANGCARWVGKPGTFLEFQDIPGIGNFKGARLQCTPYYHDWASEGVFYVMAGEIVPSSAYDVETFAASCQGYESTCTAVSAPRRMSTGRSGDVTAPYQNPAGSLSQPDGLDVGLLVAKFKGALSPSKGVLQLQPNLPELNGDINALDILAGVDAFRGKANAFDGPCPCPSLVTCGGSCTTGCSGMCVKTCVGGANAGDPCITDLHCPGSTCGTGFCRDSCGRCTPP